MENKIMPTAEEFIQNFIIKSHKPHSLNDRGNAGSNTEMLMIEFAKLHVEAAIKTCIEEAPSGSSTDTVSYEDVVEALKDCYPLEKIK